MIVLCSSIHKKVRMAHEIPLPALILPDNNGVVLVR